MTTFYTMPSRRVSTANDHVSPLVSLSDREKIMAVLADPSAHGPEVLRAINVLKYAGRSTSDAGWWSFWPETTGPGFQVQSLVDFYFDVPEEESDAHCVHPDVPQYVPAGWAESLDVRAIEDTEFRLPWLDDL